MNDLLSHIKKTHLTFIFINVLLIFGLILIDDKPFADAANEIFQIENILESWNDDILSKSIDRQFELNFSKRKDNPQKQYYITDFALTWKNNISLISDDVYTETNSRKIEKFNQERNHSLCGFERSFYSFVIEGDSKLFKDKSSLLLKKPESIADFKTLWNTARRTKIGIFVPIAFHDSKPEITIEQFDYYNFSKGEYINEDKALNDELSTYFTGDKIIIEFKPTNLNFENINTENNILEFQGQLINKSNQEKIPWFNPWIYNESPIFPQDELIYTIKIACELAIKSIPLDVILNNHLKNQFIDKDLSNKFETSFPSLNEFVFFFNHSISDFNDVLLNKQEEFRNEDEIKILGNSVEADWIRNIGIISIVVLNFYFYSYLSYFYQKIKKSDSDLLLWLGFQNGFFGNIFLITTNFLLPISCLCYIIIKGYSQYSSNEMIFNFSLCFIEIVIVMLTFRTLYEIRDKITEQN